jgi:oxygen-independent coproporphyrinogen-3 oxidase
MGVYLESIKKEAVFARENYPYGQILAETTVNSIYLGGGSPSIIPLDGLLHLLESLLKIFRCGEKIEISVELNPADVTEDLLKALRSAGVNRISLGAQTLDKGLLELMNRRHDPAMAEEAFMMCMEAGIPSVSVDLILGFPTQDLRSFDYTLERVLEWAPHHISGYMLDLKENTPLAASILNGEIQEPEDDQAAHMWRRLVNLCVSNGFDHYEISNFAKPNHRSTHNLKYWRDEIFLGLGAGAHGMIGNYRYSNIEDVDEYIRVTNLGLGPIVGLSKLSPLGRFKDALIMGGRLVEGVDLLKLGEDYQIDAKEYALQTIADFMNIGLCVIDNNLLRLTQNGMLLSNQIFSRWL